MNKINDLTNSPAPIFDFTKMVSLPTQPPPVNAAFFNEQPEKISAPAQQIPSLRVSAPAISGKAQPNSTRKANL